MYSAAYLGKPSVLYTYPVDLSVSAGKNRATKQKVDALQEMFGQVRVIDASLLPRAFRMIAPIAAELASTLYLIRNFSETKYYISRGAVGVVSIPVARMLKVYTIREVHADLFEEIGLYRKSWIRKAGIFVMGLFSRGADYLADRRVFNNPLLKKHFLSKGVARPDDVVAYNGAAAPPASSKSVPELREQYRFVPSKRYLVFTGSCSPWHGVEYLVDLQRELLCKDRTVQIVVGGGLVDRNMDPEALLINYSPLNAAGCTELARAADICLLPVAQNRVSPGSPLKLYDYMAVGAVVVAQANLPGYSDEVENFRCGICVDFTNPSSAADRIIELLNDPSLMRTYGENGASRWEEYSWGSRINSWLGSPGGACG